MIKTKRIIATIIMVTLLFAVFSTGTVASAAEIINTGKCGERLTWKLYNDGQLIISGTGDMVNYTSVNQDGVWMSTAPWGSAPKYVDIKDGVTSIGECAFYGCIDLKSVEIPDSVVDIGNYAFQECANLNNVTIGNGVKKIGDGAFSWCNVLESVSIPSSVESIGDSAFICCKGLKNLNLSNGLKSIGMHAFQDCSALTSVNIPDSVLSIAGYSFYWCMGLTSITLGCGVESIGEFAFYGCTSVPSITILNSVTSIGNYAFHAPLNDEYYPLDIVFFVNKHSCAYQYAIDNNIQYVLISKGDADGDGIITVSDALAALRIAAKLVVPTAGDFAVLDIDGDGVIAVNDALAILRVAAKLVDSL